MPAADSSRPVRIDHSHPQSCHQDKREASRGKFNRLQRTTARFTPSALDGYGLRENQLTRPARTASYLILVHRPAPLLHAAFRPRLTTTPWRFAMTSPPSGCQRDFHPQAVEHARHTGFGFFCRNKRTSAAGPKPGTYREFNQFKL